MKKTFCLFILFTSVIVSKPRWQLAHKSDGVSVFKREIKGSSLVEVKATTTLNFSIQTILAVSLDFKRFKEWQPYLESFDRLVTKSDKEFTNYFAMKMPWPLANRDLVTKTFIHVDHKNHWVHIKMRETNHRARPRRKGFIRVPLNRATWSFKPVKNGQATWIEMRGRVDPGGAIPHWLINWMGKYRIVEGFNQLKARIKKVKGNNENEVVKEIKLWH